RAWIAAEIANLRAEDNLKRGPEVPIGTSTLSPISQQEAADMMNVHARTVKRAKKVQTNGHIELQLRRPAEQDAPPASLLPGGTLSAGEGAARRQSETRSENPDPSQ